VIEATLFYLKKETDRVSETLCVLRNIRRWRESKNMILLNVVLTLLREEPG
jgi:hypothetical protein